MKKMIAAILSRMAKKLDPQTDPNTELTAEFVLADVQPKHGVERKTSRVLVRQYYGRLEIFIDHYAPKLNGKHQELVALEIWEDRLRMAYWPESDSTHTKTIDLENARTSRRFRESGSLVLGQDPVSQVR